MAINRVGCSDTNAICHAGKLRLNDRHKHRRIKGCVFGISVFIAATIGFFIRENGVLKTLVTAGNVWKRWG